MFNPGPRGTLLYDIIELASREPICRQYHGQPQPVSLACLGTGRPWQSEMAGTCRRRHMADPRSGPAPWQAPPARTRFLVRDAIAAPASGSNRLRSLSRPMGQPGEMRPLMMRLRCPHHSWWPSLLGRSVLLGSMAVKILFSQDRVIRKIPVAGIREGGGSRQDKGDSGNGRKHDLLHGLFLRSGRRHVVR
jgi:hypothetical protein